MRSALLVIIVLLALPACQPESSPTSTALPKPTATLVSVDVKRDLVRLIWEVRNGEGRKFEIIRKSHSEPPWKHFATVVPVNGLIQIDDTAAVPGQGYTYRLRIYLTTGDAYLDEVQVEVPL
jgi:hypothetical protein